MYSKHKDAFPGETIDMPEINGFEMLRVKGGARDYIIKPIKEDLLVEKVNKILGIENDKLSWDKI